MRITNWYEWFDGLWFDEMKLGKIIEVGNNNSYHELCFIVI